MPLTQGSVTIKTAGGDYSSWAGFWDDLGNLDGHITCTVDASAFTEAAGPAAITETLGGFTLHVLPAAFPTKTDATDGARFTFNTTDAIMDLQMEGPGTVIVEGMVMKKGTGAPTFFVYSRLTSTAYVIIIRRNILKGLSDGVYITDNTITDYSVYNNIIYDCVFRGIRAGQSFPNAIIANNTIHNCLDNIYDGGIGGNVYKNNLSYGATDKCFEFIASADGYNNADSDDTGEDADWSTGANNVPGIADPFNNLAADDFIITAEGDIGTAGLDLSGDFTDDFFGVTRVNWTIGACEYITPPTPKAVGGTLALSGTLANALELSRSYGGTLALSGTLANALELSRSYGGTLALSGALSRGQFASMAGALTPSGTLVAAFIIVQATGGELMPLGTLAMRNPDWLLIDEILTWMGEWDKTYPYDINDVVLYKSTGGNEWHVFVSKIGHNVGNIPTSSAEAWRRLYQEQWS